MKRLIGLGLALLVWPAAAPAVENLDPNSRTPTHELEMAAGRLNKVPVSVAWHGQFTFTSGPQGIGAVVHVRVRCANGSRAAADECDPGLLVAATDAKGQALNVAYNNDSPVAGGNGLGSYLSLTQGPSQTVTYKVVVYSHIRGTSRVHVDWDSSTLVTPPDWDPHPFADPLNPDRQQPNLQQIVGGVLVKLGPVSSSDHFNVRTEDDGALAGTRMWLFNTTRRAFAFVDGPVTGDRDPDFLFSNAWTCDASCGRARQASTSYAIVGKDDVRSGLEVWVDLVKSISADETFAEFPAGICAGGAERPDCPSSQDITLDPGVYFFSVFVTTSFAVGAVPAIDGGAHPGYETGDERCLNIDWDTFGLVSMDRGQGNDLALTLELVEDGLVVRTRHVPRGALGAEWAAGVEWNRLTLEHTVPDDGVAHQYRINLRTVGPMVIVDGRWSFRRNPESVELKVASLNMEYGDNMQQLADVHNAADLLGAGPNYVGSEVFHRANRGQWRWEGDILNFNEMMSDRGGWMQDRLNARTTLPWLRSEGESIWPNNNPWGTTRYGPVLMNLFGRKGGGDPSFGGLLDQIDDCNSEFNHCRLVAADDFGPAERVYYTVPARGAVRRMKGSTGGFLERPIAVFHVYLPYADDEIKDRDTATTKLVRHIKELLAREPSAFNSAGNADPRDLGNRVVILGDVNMVNNQCSEVNATLRKLREAFGYAIDVSMAVTDGDDRTFDMHYSGAPITDFRTGTYGDCKDPDWAGDWGQGGNPGCPFHYRNISSWKAEGEPHTTGLDQWYPWWAGTSTGQGGGGSRLDLIILAGLGWADDDPVREYLAMANSEVPNVGNGFQVAGVEMRHYCSEPDQHLTLGAPANYHPENPVCSGIPAQPGALAFRSDHKPVGARLRVQFYR